MRLIQKSAILCACLTMIFFYQNCSNASRPVAFSGSEDNKSQSPTEGNGQGYDGKVYVVMGEKCPDGTKLRSRIAVNSATSANLTRYECDEIQPVALGPNDFQLNPNNPRELFYENQIFTDMLVGTKLDLSLANQEIGNCFLMIFDFGTPADNSASNFQSLLQIYEDGKPLGPAHATHSDIRNQGQGLFSHWEDSGIMTLRFSASDNTDPLTNGRIYTWDIRR